VIRLEPPDLGVAEFFGGILVLVGLGTRLVSLPLAFTMVIAILTAKRADITGLTALVGLEEWSYLVWRSPARARSRSIAWWLDFAAHNGRRQLCQAAAASATLRRARGDRRGAASNRRRPST
jgi:hypothetical protein